MELQHVRVWDLPTRVFHWTLAVLVVIAFVTGLQGGNAMLWHERAGLGILGLLSFRLLWGVVGSSYARFADFLPTPARVLAYVQGRWQGLGHNPLGALAVFALLGVLLVQAISGLFATDDIAFEGPLFHLASLDLSAALSRWHRQAMWLIGGLIGLHIAAALFYTLIKRTNVIRPMITGVKSVPSAQAQPARGGGLLMFLLCVALAALVVWVAAGGLLPPPPAPVVPAW